VLWKHIGGEWKLYVNIFNKGKGQKANLGTSMVRDGSTPFDGDWPLPSSGPESSMRYRGIRRKLSHRSGDHQEDRNGYAIWPA
jgi:hypothetical protein